ncbi:MAG: hypothetical protein JSR49_11080, partial [Proteobacteria bacterium]|nr:hypothetical protein [Pseudomonadota bacterium]
GVAFFVGTPRSDLQMLARAVGLSLHSLAADASLARHLGAKDGSVALVRPDAYLAACLPMPTPDQLQQALETLQ